MCVCSTTDLDQENLQIPPGVCVCAALQPVHFRCLEQNAYCIEGMIICRHVTTCAVQQGPKYQSFAP